MIRTHEAADAFLRGGRDSSSRPLPGQATRLERRGDSIAVCYRGTDVVTFHPDGTLTLDRGGYLTRTTQARIEEYTGLRVTSGRLDSLTRERLVRRGPEDWTLATPDGHLTTLADGRAFMPGH